MVDEQIPGARKAGFTESPIPGQMTVDECIAEMDAEHALLRDEMYAAEESAAREARRSYLAGYDEAHEGAP